MPPAASFGSFGLLAVPGFLERDLCAEIRQEMATAGEVAATVRDRSFLRSGSGEPEDELGRGLRGNVLAGQRAFAVAPQRRREGLRSRGERRSAAAVPALRRGDFFAAHQDRGSDMKGAEFARQRQVSVVIFLNDETSEARPDTYEGDRSRSSVCSIPAMIATSGCPSSARPVR